MCGIIGMKSNSDTASLLYEGMLLLQHRGQESAGICVSDPRGRFRAHKGLGLVSSSIQPEMAQHLTGEIGIGHVRYPTAGALTLDETQPFYVSSPCGISLSHNGNLVNSPKLRERLSEGASRHINTDSDSEVLLNVIAEECDRQRNGSGLNAAKLLAALKESCGHCRGGYTAVGMVSGVGLFALRDPWGIRPLCYGERETGEYVFASESLAIEGVGFKFVRDLAPGECIVIDFAGEMTSVRMEERDQPATCLFEYVYLARPDSIIDGVSVYKARVEMGRRLAERIKKDYADVKIDVVMPVPDTSRSASIELANSLAVPYREGLVKNRYVQRTFMMSGQRARSNSVRLKMRAIGSEFKGKNVLLVDDSIVRGTTARQIIELARNAGAHKVFMVSAAPPVRHSNFYGIDIPLERDLIACDRDVEAVCARLGADLLIYQSMEDLIASVTGQNPKLQTLEGSCFDGKYIVEPDEDFLAAIETSNEEDQRYQGYQQSIDLRVQNL